MKAFYRLSAFAVACLFILSAFVGCKDRTEGQDTEAESYSGMPEYDAENIGNYIKPFEYTGRTVYAKVGETRQEAVWNSVVAAAEILSYPEAQVEYYASQERAKYRYYASRDGIDYGELLVSLGVTEESFYEKARGYVKEDLVLEYIARDAGIVLTDAEKQTHLDKYAERLSEVYGNDKEYIKANMTEQIYDAMLGDKIMEYLLLNNTVYTSQSK